jgi:imidazole glycerol-phosphate synthase subunit HisH
MIGIVDYGIGNVASLSNALKQLGYESMVTDDPAELMQSTHIILPGVGSYKAAVLEIEERKLRNLLIELAKVKPFLGICLGMQLLFSNGFEGEPSKGLDLIPGTVEKIETEYILPHIGWNTLSVTNEKEIFGSYQGHAVYFVHSYGVKTAPKYIVAETDYGVNLPAIVKRKNIIGMQFHPEKSGAVGMSLLKTFLKGEKE